MGSYLPVISWEDRGFHTSGWGHPSGTIAAGIWPTANMIYYAPFTVGDTFTSVAGWITQSSAGAASLGRVGVYSSSAGEPGTKLGETNGTIDLTTAGTVIRRTAFSANVALSPGTIYFAAITVSSAAAWTGIGYNGVTGPISEGNLHGWRQEAGSGTLPTTATPAVYAPATEFFWMFGLTQSTTIPL